jgi:hypothetical protein
MTRRAADQHAVVNRWHSVADDLAGAVQHALDIENVSGLHVDRERLAEALRRYEEARRA